MPQATSNWTKQKLDDWLACFTCYSCLSDDCALFLVALNQPNTCTVQYTLDLYFHNYHSIKPLCNIFLFLLILIRWYSFILFQVAKSVDQSLEAYAKKTINDINGYFLHLHASVQLLERDLLFNLKSKITPMMEGVKKAAADLDNSLKILNVSFSFSVYSGIFKIIFFFQRAQTHLEEIRNNIPTNQHIMSIIKQVLKTINELPCRVEMPDVDENPIS